MGDYDEAKLPDVHSGRDHHDIGNHRPDADLEKPRTATSSWTEKRRSCCAGETGLGLTINDVVQPRQVSPQDAACSILISAISSESLRISVNIVIDVHTQLVVAVFQPNAVGMPTSTSPRSPAHEPAVQRCWCRTQDWADFNAGAGNRQGSRKGSAVHGNA